MFIRGGTLLYYLRIQDIHGPNSYKLQSPVLLSSILDCGGSGNQIAYFFNLYREIAT